MGSQEAHTSRYRLLAVLLLVSFVFGGGGARYGIANLLVQLTAIAVLMSEPSRTSSFWGGAPAMLRFVIILSIALPAFQVIPLPKHIWIALPGRDLVASSLELVGGKEWMTFSVDPLRTLLALTALITPIAVLVVGWNLPRERLIDLGWMIVTLGIVTVALGAVQLSGASDAATPYGSRSPGNILLGTFANRNSTGLFLTFSLGLAALLPAPKSHPAVLSVRLAICVLLLLAVFLTQSRTGVVLAVLPLALGIARIISWKLPAGRNGSNRPGLMTSLAAVALIGATVGAVVTAGPSRITTTIERFQANDDPRRFIWNDAIYSASRYWPMGAGIGTFDEVYQVDESLENMTQRRAGRAHNDYIELVVEAGALGLAVAALWLAHIVWLSWRVRHSSNRWAAWAGSAFLVAIASQSITDYPLRNQTILALASFALLLLTRIGTDYSKAKL